MPFRPLPSAAALLLAWAVLGAPGSSADEPQARARPFGVRDTTRARFAVEEARRLLAAGEVDRALRQIQEGLEQHAHDLYLEEQTEASERWRPAGAVLEELLDGLPAEALTRYDALTGPAAEPLRARALASGDEAPLLEIRRRFGAGRQGVEATRLLVERAMEAGDLRRAAMLAGEALHRAPQDALLWWRRMEALAALGDGAALAALAPPPGLVLETRRGPVALTARLEALRAATPAAAGAQGWPMWGGDPSRTRAAPAESGRSTALRWVADTSLQPREHDLPGNEAEGDDQLDFEAHLDAYRPLFPAADARTLYVSDGRALRALDVFSGRPLWRVEDPLPGLPLLPSSMLARGRTAFDRPFAPTLWREHVIATLEVSTGWREDRVLNMQVNTYMPRRALVALSRENGRLLWRAGADEADRERLRRVHFCSEPVVADDVVVALGARYENYEDVALFGVSASSGRVLWETPLVYGQQETNLFGNPVKEFSAGAVSARDGVAYAGTGLGCLAAVRVADGRLQWLASYDVIPIEPVQVWFQPKIRRPRVGPTAPLVTRDLVVVAPGDALHVNAYDRTSGTLRWRAPHETLLRTRYGTLLQVVGVARMAGREALVLTSSTLDALDLATGRLLARGRFDPEGSQVRGQGAVRGREVLVPTSAGLQRFSLDAELKLLGRDAWSEEAEPGNLLALGHVLVVAGRGRLQGHYAWEDVERDLLRRRRERPGDPEVLLEAGDLYLRGRGPAEARAAFRAALDLAPPGSPLAERARRGLFDAWLAEGAERGKTEAVRGAPAWREALALAATPAEHVEARLALDGALAGRHDERIANLERLYEEAGDANASGSAADEAVSVRAVTLLRLARIEEDAQRPVQAVAALQRLLEVHGDARLGIEPARTLAQRRIAQVLAHHGPQPYAPFEERARAGLEAARAQGDAAALERVLATWPNASVVPAAQLALGQTLLATGQAAPAAERLRAMLARHPAHPLAASALVPLLRAYGILGALGARRAVLAALDELPADTLLELDGRQVSALEAARAERGAPPQPPADALPASWQLPLVERLVDPPADEEITLPVLLATEPGEQAPLALTVRGGMLRAYNLVKGERAFELPEADSRRAGWSEDTLALVLRGELRGVEPTRGATRWSREHLGAVHDLVVSRGVLVVTGQDPAAGSAERSLEAFDARTGLPLWSVPLGVEPVAGLSAVGGQVLLTRLRSDRSGQRTRLLVVDLLSGAPLREIELATAREARDLIVPGLVLTAGPDEQGGARRVAAIELATGRTRWNVALDNMSAVSALAADGERVWALQQDGRLTQLALADGARTHRTHVETGAARAAPALGTQAMVRDGRLTLLATGLRDGSPLLSFDLASGKLRWAVEAEPLARTQQHELLAAGDRWVVLTAGVDASGARRVLVRVVVAAEGTVEQEIEVAAGPANGLATLASGPGAILVVTGGGAAVYAQDTAGMAAPEAR